MSTVRSARWLALLAAAACHPGIKRSTPPAPEPSTTTTAAPAPASAPAPAPTTAAAPAKTTSTTTTTTTIGKPVTVSSTAAKPSPAPPLVAPSVPPVVVSTTSRPAAPPPLLPSAASVRVMEVSPDARFSNGVAAGIVLLINSIDVNAAQLVENRSIQPEVRAFARRMITDHSTLDAQLRELLGRIDLTARDDDTSRQIRERSTLQRDLLRELSGRAFDTAYVRSEIEFHRQVVSVIDDALAKNTSRGELRDYLMTLRPAESAHLANAEQVRAALLARR